MTKPGETSKDWFTTMVNEHSASLKSFLYRFTTSKEDTEDIAQETFIRAYQKLGSFKGESSFKTWIFAIATNLAKDQLRAKKRWPTDAQDKCRDLISTTPLLQAELKSIAHTSETGKYEIREHIDFCFTCVMKTLSLEQQLTLMLADIYAFKVKEITSILKLTTGVVKHHLHNARKTMQEVFEHRCALINKKGICHQCSELNGLRNDKAETLRKINEQELVKAASQKDEINLLAIRSRLVQSIDPLKAQGTTLHDFLLRQTNHAVDGNPVAKAPDHEEACCTITNNDETL